MSTQPGSDAAPARRPARMRRRWRWVPEVAIVLALILGIRAWQQRGMAEGIAPPLAGSLLDGRTVELAALDPARDRRPVLVYFWASWCAICRMQHGAIADIAREHPVVSVAMRSGDAAAVRRHLTEQAAAFDVINDPHGLHAARWGVGAVPASFIVDARGRVRFVEVGYTTGWGLRWRLWWAGWRVGP